MNPELYARDYFSFTIRILAAFLIGGLIGWQREMAEKPAGLRTHILVCVGSTLMTIVSISTFGKMGADPARITAQIVSGIGFLGAGTIFRYGPTVTGLTTAASLWAISGIGIALGAGAFFIGLVATGFIFLTLWLLEYLEKRFLKRRAFVIHLRVLREPGIVERLEAKLETLGIRIERIKVQEEEGKLFCTLHVHTPLSRKAVEVISALQTIEALREVEVV